MKGFIELLAILEGKGHSTVLNVNSIVYFFPSEKHTVITVQTGEGLKNIETSFPFDKVRDLVSKAME